MLMYGIIYKITNKVDGKVYIGQTKQGTVSKRYNGSIRKTSNAHLRNAIEKYGIENFEVTEPFDTADSKDELDAKEKYYIALYDSTDPKRGYNLMSGGHNGTHSEETRKKISDAQRGCLNHMYGKYGEENHLYSRIKTKCDYCEKEIMVARARFKRSKHHYCCPEHKKLSHIHVPVYKSKKVDVICEVCGETFSRYPSMIKNNKHFYCSNECRNKAFETLYAGRENPNFGNHKVAGGNNGRARKVVCLTTGEVFSCAVEASEKYGLTKGLVTACCRGDQKSAGGMVWRFCD